MTTSKQEPKLLEEPKHREMARRIRDHQWETLERIADKNPLYVCWWDKNRHHRRREHQPDDLKVCGLIDGMELVHWLKTHPEWTTTGDWSDERYAAPVWITEAGRTALENRHLYDMEPVEGGLVEPGWRAKPRQQGYSSGHDALPGS